MAEAINRTNIEQRVTEFRTWGQTELKNPMAKELVSIASTLFRHAYDIENNQYGGTTTATREEVNPRSAR